MCILFHFVAFTFWSPARVKFPGQLSSQVPSKRHTCTFTLTSPVGIKLREKIFLRKTNTPPPLNKSNLQKCKLIP